MARLPSVSSNTVLTQGPQSTLSAAQIANPYQQIAEAFGTIGTKLEEHNINQAAEDGANAVYRDAGGNLKVDTRKGISKSVETYNRAAHQAYTTRLAGDIRAKGTTLMQESQGNVDAFNSSWKGFSDTLLAGVPKEARGAVATMLDTNGSQFGLGVSEQKRTRDIKVFENDLKTEIQYLNDEMAGLARGGGTGTAAYQEKQSQLRSLYGELVANPEFTVSQKQADMDLQRIESRHTSEALVGAVDKQLASGGIGAAQKEIDRILTDEKLALSPPERRQYAGMMEERVRGWQAERKVALKPFQDQKDNLKKLFDQGVAIDTPEVDTTISALARGGDMAGALELSAARNTAKVIQNFKLADPESRVAALERGVAAANGIYTGMAGAGIIDKIIGVESSGNPNAVSGKGAAGLMQVMPATGAEIAAEINDFAFPANGTEAEQQAYLKDPETSRRYGTHYFNKMMNRYGGDHEAALIAYNGGAARADAWISAGRDDSVIPRESADYYKKVLGSQASFQSTGRTLGQSGPSAARSFLQSRTDKDATHIDGLDGAFGNKLAAFIKSAPAGIGEGLGLYSGSRTIERQAEIISENASKYGIDRAAWERDVKTLGPVDAGKKWAEEFKRTGLSANIGKPGSSNHNHGTAADLSYNGKSLAEAPKEVIDWVHANAKNFSLKLPLSNENWHIEDDSTRGGQGTVATVPTIDPEIIKEYRSGVTADAKAFWPDIKSGIEKGMVPSPNELSVFARQIALVDDPQFRSEVGRFFQTEAGGAAIAQLPKDQAEAVISALKADASAGATIAQQDIISSAERQTKAQAEALKSDPIGFAVERRMSPAVPPLDLAGAADDIATAFGARQNSVDLLRARGLVGNVSALRPDDMAMLNRTMQASTPQQQAQILGAMAGNLKPDTYLATMTAMAGNSDSRKMAAAGALYQKNPQAAEGVLRGQALLKENALLAPRNTDSNKENIDEILPSNSFGSGLEAARQSILEAATARYADLSNIAGDTSGELNSERMTQAVNEVSGGMLDFNGETVVAPRYGMKQNDFDALMKDLPENALRGMVTSDGVEITARELKKYGRLKAVGEGQYLIAFGVQGLGLPPTYAMSAKVTGDSITSRVGGGAFVLDLREGNR